MRTGRPLGRLPLHLRPLPHEALSSWVDRLAGAYGLERHRFLRSAFGADPTSDGGELDVGGSPGLAAALAERTGVPAERVRAMALAGYAPELTGAAEPSPGLFEAYAGRFGWFVPPARAVARTELSELWAPWLAEDLLGPTPRCCPRCLLAGPCPYVRLHWRLAWMASCPLHGEMLAPLLAYPSLLRSLREREPKYAAPHLLALDRITLGAATTGQAVLPRASCLAGRGGAAGGRPRQPGAQRGRCGVAAVGSAVRHLAELQLCPVRAPAAGASGSAAPGSGRCCPALGRAAGAGWKRDGTYTAV